jgi:hypothetical protein
VVAVAAVLAQVLRRDLVLLGGGAVGQAVEAAPGPEVHARLRGGQRGLAVTGVAAVRAGVLDFAFRPVQRVQTELGVDAGGTARRFLALFF